MNLFLPILIGLIIVLLFTVILGRIIGFQKHKISSKNCVQLSKYIKIGSIEQYIQKRGQNRSNPVMIVLHGGPGNTMAYYSYSWQKGLEPYYTIIHWDQRGCGNTYYRNQKSQKPTLDLLLSDLDELVAFICSEFDKEKVIIMGHSWGTFLGGIYAGMHPEKVIAYVGISQMLDFMKSEQASTQEALRLANIDGSSKDTAEISRRFDQLMCYPKFDKQQAINLIKFRQLKEKYLPPQYNNKLLFYRFFSPYITLDDFKWMMRFDKLIDTNNQLYDVLFSKKPLSMYDYSSQYDIPVIIISGEHDWTTPVSLATDYFHYISAPSKALLVIKGAGNLPFMDKPEDFTETLLAALNSALKN